MIKIYLLSFVKAVVNFLKEGDRARVVVVSIFCLILFSIAIFSFILGQGFIVYMEAFSPLSKIFLEFTLLVLISAISLLSFLSFTIAFLKNLFDRNLQYFFLTGVNSFQIAGSVFISTLLMGSWPFILISLPFFFGMFIKSSQTILHFSFLKVLILHGFISVVLASLGGIFALALCYFIGRKLYKLFPILIVSGLVILFITFTKFIFPENLQGIASQVEISQLKARLALFPIASPFLPTSAFISSFMGNSNSLILLTFESIISFFLFLFLAKELFRKLWQASFEGNLIADRRSDASRRRFILSKRAETALIEKEFLYLLREKGVFVYFSFIVFLTSIFAFFLRLTSNMEEQYLGLFPIVKLAVFFTIAYLVLLANIRFVFPTFSLEAPFSWSVISSKGIRKKISLVKWSIYFSLVSFFTVVIGVIVIYFSKIEIIAPNVLFPLILGNTIITTSVAIGMGQIFQRDLPRDDADKISTTNPGILLTAVSLLISILLAFIIFSPIGLYLSWSLLFLSIAFLIWFFQFSARIYLRSDI